MRPRLRAVEALDDARIGTTITTRPGAAFGEADTDGTGKEPSGSDAKMQFGPTPVLGTPRLVLRPYASADAERFVELFTDGEVMRHLDGALGRSVAAEVFERVLDVTAQEAWWLWAITDRVSGEMIGHAELKPQVELEAVEAVYMLHRRAWGQGYASEAADVVIRAGTRQFSAPLVATVNPANTASQKVLARVGMCATGESTSDGLLVFRPADR